MWIMTNNSYLSVVSKDCGPAELLVRARRAGDIERVFPDAKVTRNTNSDSAHSDPCRAFLYEPRAGRDAAMLSGSRRRRGWPLKRAPLGPAQSPRARN